MQKIKVTFETKCWENDWRILLTAGILQRMIDACNYDFAQKTLYINNVLNKYAVSKQADKLVGKNVINDYYFVEDHAPKALDHFQIDKESFKGGYFYSIQELVGIFLCSTDYVLHFSGDAMIQNREAWIEAAIERMEADPCIKVANPSWKKDLAEAKAESFSEDDCFFKSYGFSDQCYLVRAADFKGRIYNEKHPDSQRYPLYGGELFEKRVDAYMRNHTCTRLTSKRAYYLHKNFPRDSLRRWIMIVSGINLKK
jgi:hypothetical protein